MEKNFFLFTVRVFGGPFPYFDAIAKLYRYANTLGAKR
jgi:hypothetical protein